jgi:hypothetical protein
MFVISPAALSRQPRPDKNGKKPVQKGKPFCTGYCVMGKYGEGLKILMREKAVKDKKRCAKGFTFLHTFIETE